MKILVVDDDLVDRTITATLLRKLGHDVVEASNAMAALRAMQKQRFTVVVSDRIMPGLSGIDL
ncbi:MAG TPA: response regulator [Bryobacteraceae bacterium]|nr:response regulator [Bryobacteraceae bacterium]